jgi:GNAT superfamily N-acetyltransferase
VALFVEVVAAEEVAVDRAVLRDTPYQREFGWDRLICAAPQWYLLGMLADRMIGSALMLERVITVGDVSLRVGGITRVVTEPAYRRQGVARRLVADAIACLRDDRHVPFALLTRNRRLGPLYEKLGWRVVAGPTICSQPGGLRTCPGLTMPYDCGTARRPAGPIDMRGLPW